MRGLHGERLSTAFRGTRTHPVASLAEEGSGDEGGDDKRERRRQAALAALKKKSQRQRCVHAA